jgi:hypothetical protein
VATIKRKPRGEISHNPANFPVEISMLFERAAYNPVRVPEAGKGFETEKAAFGARMVMSRWKSQMYRSKECPKAWKDLISMIQFQMPSKDDTGWCFYIRPYSGSTVELAKGVAQSFGVEIPQTDEFWKTYTQEV